MLVNNVQITENQIAELGNQIWCTRISRINAEKRLINKENFIQAMNIYYSCFTVIVSIVTLKYSNDAINILNVCMTISLMISLLYFKSMKYSDCAINFRKNYTELHRLEMRLKHITDISQLQEIEEKYCSLLNSSENHITHDYLTTIRNSKASFKQSRWTIESELKYWVGVIWRIFVKLLCILLPLLIIAFLYWGEYIGGWRF